VPTLKRYSYKTLKVMIGTNNSKSFEEIFNVIPKTVVAVDLGIHYTRFLTKVRKPEDFMLKDLIKLSSLMDADPELVIRLALKGIESRRGVRKKKAN
jgi:hypothetical protein